MSSFSGFHLNIKMRRELKPTHMTVVPVTSQAPHLPSFSRSSFFTWLSWGSHRVLLKPPWIYCVLVFMLGSSWSCQESQALGAGAGRTPQECGTGGKTSILGIHAGWKLSYLLVHIYLCAPGCHVCIFVSLWAIYVIQVSCNVCVSMSVCVQQWARVVKRQRSSLKGSLCWFLSWPFEWRAKEEFSP